MFGRIGGMGWVCIWCKTKHEKFQDTCSSCNEEGTVLPISNQKLSIIKQILTFTKSFLETLVLLFKQLK